MNEVIIVGAGLAGLTAATVLSQEGYDVTVLEKKTLPRHKVCGEYLSSEVLPLFEDLGIQLPARPRIKKFILSSPKGNSIEADLPLGGIGISRFVLDHALYERALENGVTIEQRSKVHSVVFTNGHFKVTTSKGKEYSCRQVIASFGKGAGWKTLQEVNQKNRKIQMGVKQYYEYPMDEELVVLHNFRGGYGGAVQVENGWVDVAYMVEQDVFTSYKKIELLEQELLHNNPFLKELMTSGKQVWEKPMTISNFQLGKRQLVENHILYAGDAAAMIPPASGNGMAMAIWGGYLAARSTEKLLNDSLDRTAVEKHFKNEWNHKMSTRLFWGQQFQKLMGSGWPAELAMSSLKVFPSLLPRLIQLTHA